MSNDRIWTLVARKLSGEASTEEIVELASLLREKPELHLQIQAISEIWNYNKNEDRTELGKSYQLWGLL